MQPETGLLVVAHARNGFTDKFGIPRQSREASSLETRIVFTADFQDANMVRGLDGFSHLWLVWGFTEAKGWSATVRPPRLGGNKRLGVFATRSPFRPNHLGLSSVRLLRLELPTATSPMALVVSGADLMDGTPIYDIKPYLSFSDSHEDAINGFADESKDYRLPVMGLAEGETELREILSQDPRPSYQDDPLRVYKLDYKGRVVSFRVADSIVYVDNIAPK